MNTAERWLPVPGWEGLYEVSDQGQVRSLPRPRARGDILRPAPDKDGYLLVNLSGRGALACTRVHRLVALAFKGRCPDGMVARHLNGNNQDNRAENLAWGTYRENNLDTVRHGRNRDAAKTHCHRGHPFDEENTYWLKGKRGCRACNRAAVARYKARRTGVRP